MVAESPGPGAAGSGSTGVLSPFVNDDPTARNMRRAISDAGLDPSWCVYWNAVPQVVPRGKLSAEDRARGVGYLRDVIQLCPDLRAVVALGRKAASACRRVGVDAIETWHPSPLGLYGGGAVGRYDDFVEALRLAAAKAAG